MKAKVKIGPTIVRFFILMLGLVFALFSAKILLLLIFKFEFIGLIVFMMMLLFALVFLFFGHSCLSQIIVNQDERSLEIVYLSILRIHKKDSSISGYCVYPFNNGIGTYSGILLELNGGKQIQLSEFDIKNFKEIETAISTFVKYKKDIKLRIWTKFNKILLVIAILLVILMIFGKMPDF